MTMPPRDPKTGRFVKSTPPAALPALPLTNATPFAIGNRRVTAAALRAQSARLGRRTGKLPPTRAQVEARRRAARANGYTGPLTRADLARAL